jgi:hypothetical protein
MEVNRIIAEIDAQIAKLQQARALLAGTAVAAATAVVRGPGRPKGVKKGVKKGPGRPKGSKNAKTVSVVAKVLAPRKRKISAEGRQRIAEAMKLRWAERKKQATAK